MKQKETNYLILAKEDFSKKSNIYLYLMFSLFLLLVNDYNNITYMKYITFLILTGVYIFSIMFSYCGMALEGLKFRLKFKKTFFLKPEFFLVLYLFFGIVSFIFSPYKGLRNSQGKLVFWHGSGRYDGFLTLLLYVVIFLLLSNFSNFNIKHIIVISVTTLLMCFVAIIQFCGINFLDFYPVFNGKITYLISTIGNLGMFSGLLCMIISIVITVFIFLENSRVINLLLLFTQLISIYTFYALGVNSGKIALFVVMLVVFPFALRYKKNLIKLLDFLAVFVTAIGLNKLIKFKYVKKRKITEINFKFDKTLIVFAIIILIFIALHFVLNKYIKDEKIDIRFTKCLILIGVVILAFAFVFWLFSLEDRTAFEKGQNLKTEILNLFKGNLSDESGNYRIGIWKNSLKMGTENFFFGTGIGTFLEAFKDYMAGTPVFKTQKLLDAAHNEYIHLFCTVGFLGFLSYLSFLVCVAIKAFKNVYKNPYILILGSAVLAYLIYAFFSFSIVIITPIFWIFIGVLYNKIKKEESKNENIQ